MCVCACMCVHDKCVIGPVNIVVVCLFATRSRDFLPVVHSTRLTSVTQENSF